MNCLRCHSKMTLALEHVKLTNLTPSLITPPDQMAKKKRRHLPKNGVGFSI